MREVLRVVARGGVLQNLGGLCSLDGESLLPATLRGLIRRGLVEPEHEVRRSHGVLACTYRLSETGRKALEEERENGGPRPD
jgi:hypothetical protein